MQGELWKNGKLNRHLIARDMPVLAESFRLPAAAAASKFLLVEETGIGKAFPLSGEKLALVLTVYRASDFEAAPRRSGRSWISRGAAIPWAFTPPT